METKNNLRKIRIIMTVIGITLAAISVGLQKVSGLGVDPFSVLTFGFAKALDMNYPTVNILVCAVLAIVALVFDRKLLGIATIVNLIFSGFVTDGTTKVVKWIAGEELSMTIRVVLLLMVVITISIAAALYYSAELGVSPYDAQALTIADKTRIPFRAARIGTDVICCGVGFALGGDLGLATILYAFCMGPIIQFCREHFTDKMAAGEFFKKN